MKPTINTSPLTWSCTTAGINPSSFEKSIASFQVPGSRFQVPVQKKNPALCSGGAAWVANSVVLGSVRSRAQSCRATVMVVMEVMRVVENGDHEGQSVLQNRLKAKWTLSDIRVSLDFDQHIWVD